MNGIKQGGVLSATLFAVDMDGLLERLQQTGVGCRMGSRFINLLGYAADIIFIAPCKLALLILISDVKIMLLNMKFYLMGVKINYCTLRADHRLWCHVEVFINDKTVAMSNKTMHLGHILCRKDGDDITFGR